MACNENNPPSGAGTSDDDQKVSTKNDPFAKCFSKAFPNISIQPRTVQSAPVPQKAEQDSKVSSFCPQDVPLPPDETERLLVAPEHVETADQLNVDQDDADPDDDDSNFDDSDMESSEDEDIPLEEDPFFGDPTAQAPGVTALRLEEIRKALEDAKEIDDEMPALEDDNKTSPVDAIFSEQNTNPKTIVVNVGSSFSKWIYLVLEPTEPLYEMKLKFIQAADLGFEELARLEFTFAERVIGDDDTVEQVCNVCLESSYSANRRAIARNSTGLEHLLSTVRTARWTREHRAPQQRTCGQCDQHTQQYRDCDRSGQQM